jgi:hypothetical protein
VDGFSFCRRTIAMMTMVIAPTIAATRLNVVSALVCFRLLALDLVMVVIQFDESRGASQGNFLNCCSQDGSSQ